MSAWQYVANRGGIEKNLHLNSSAQLPKPKSDQHLIKVLASALNPIDYKTMENPLIWRLISKPATPGLDFAGRIVKPANGSSLESGQLVFGVVGTSPLAGGGLAELAIGKESNVIPMPEDIKPEDAATIGVAGITAYQSIVPRVKKGDKVFINGGSGGCGVFGIQIAKAVGCHVTTTCSTANVELCKSLGADEVVDYRKQNVIETLKLKGYKFDHVVDNVGSDMDLYWYCHEYTRPGAVFLKVGGGTFTMNAMVEGIKRRVLPGFLGGGKREFQAFWPDQKYEDWKQLGDWMREGKIKAVIDQKFVFDDARKAFERLKTGRSRGKVLIEVALETGGMNEKTRDRFGAWNERG